MLTPGSGARPADLDGEITCRWVDPENQVTIWESRSSHTLGIQALKLLTLVVSVFSDSGISLLLTGLSSQPLAEPYMSWFLSDLLLRVGPLSY